MTGYERILRDQGVVPLRTILRNFLNLVECCEESVNDGNDSYEKEFQELKQFSENLKSDTAYRCKEGEKTVNRKKNRYKDIVPFDYTRVILGDYGEVQGSDYINANFIKGASGSSAYIACQGPLPHTVNDFWRMVVECEVQVIVMACNEQESGKHKCENYWVEEEAVERQFGDVTIWLKKCRQVCPDFLVRTMKIRYTTPGGEIEERNVCQFHYSAWPDHGVPSKVRPLLDMVRLIRDFQTSETLPVLVHCSAGCGRTGTICAIDYVWGLLRLGKLTAEFSLFHLVSEMRRQRIAMVQTKDQYVLVHRAVKELFEEQLKIIDSHPYANVDVNGLPLDIKSDLLEEPTYETVEFHSNENKSENKQHIRSPSSTSSAVPPPLPPVFRDQASGSSRTEKDSDYSFKSQEEEKLNSATPSSRSYSAYKNIDDITVISSDTEDKVDKEKESFGHKSNSKASPIRNALLRKPSIVKLKAFFEKSKDDKKSGTTNLSRAKSDVSSRFYSFNKTFTSRGPSALTKNKSSSSTSSPPSDENITSKPKTKPALLAKPILPVKRSKSLKVGKEDENADPREAFKVSLANKAKNSTAQRENSIEKEITLNSEPHNIVSLQASSSSSNTMTVTNNPIRVCIKQVDIPQLQTAVAKSIRPEPQTATTHELRRKSIINEQEIIERSIKSKNNFEEHKYAPLTKPAIPPKSHIVLKGGGNHSYSNVAVSPSRIKMGIAKEMEDVVHSGPKSSKYGKLKKYGTVTPKSLAASINSKTSLTRSQSHVWQGNKIQLPVRIFSDENIHQTSNMHERSFPLPNTTTSKSSSMLFSKSNGEKSEHKPNEFLSDKVQDVLLDNKSMQKSFDYQMDIDRSREKPIAQRRVPKTNPYANYFPSVSSTKLLLGSQASSASQQPDSPISSTSVPQIYSMENGNRDLPQLKISYSRSRENSSESSSNTATPRSSLPGTPTQTVDPTYTQLIKSNLQGLSNNGNYGKVNNNNGNPPPKSILKGSLSSTPSESDERLDSSRPSPSTPLIIKPNVITAPQKISTVRIAVGVRERRNSFRQAVWKEEDSSHNGHNNSDVQKSPSNPFLFQNGNKTTEVSNSNSRPMLAKYPPGIHKDYEPIWPEFGNSNKNNNYPNTTGSTSFYVSNGDQYNALPNVNSNVNSAPYSSGNGNLTPIQPHHISSQISKRSRSEERTIDSTSNNRPGFQSRYDEIKVLLDELKAPNNNFTNSTMSNTNSISNPSPIPNRVRREMDSSTASGKPSSTNLKHQRSLRTPTRPQYQQGLSCFTFRKPASFESITDQIYFEENPPINSQLSQSRPYGASSNFSKENGNHVVHQNYPLQNRNTNDYVSLRQCRSSAEREVPVQNHSKDLFHNRGQSFNSIGDNSVPVAPPRTKKLQQQENARREQVQSGNSSSSNKVSECGPSTSLSVWVSSNGERVENSNLPEIVRCTNSNTNHSSEDNQVSSDSQNNLNPTSPKAIIRALGLFQAKAANMRSRFANWTETKDKSNAERSNGAPHLLSAKENDQKDDNNDGGFTSSVTSANQLPHPSRSKHQYL